MDRVQNPEYLEETRRKVEGIILNKLYAVHSTMTPNVLYSVLEDSTKAAGAYLDAALLILLNNSFVGRYGANEFYITLHGIGEYQKRKEEGTLF